MRGRVPEWGEIRRDVLEREDRDERKWGEREETRLKREGSDEGKRKGRQQGGRVTGTKSRQEEGADSGDHFESKMSQIG
jgi:hypothetical protein